MRKIATFALVGVFVLGAIFILCRILTVRRDYPPYVYVNDDNVTTLINMNIVALALEDFIQDRGFAPKSLTDLVSQHYLSGLPTNPRTDLTVQNVRLDRGPWPGNYTYFRMQEFHREPGKFQTKWTGYCLIVYGRPGSNDSMNYNAYFDIPLLDEIQDRILMANGSVFSFPPKRSDPRYSVEPVSLEQALRQEGYEW